VAVAALHGHGAAAVGAALDVHRVRQALVVLQRRVTGDVAVLAARVLEHLPDGLERVHSLLLIRGRRLRMRARRARARRHCG
jgi:hypothetical protein